LKKGSGEKNQSKEEKASPLPRACPGPPVSASLNFFTATLFEGGFKTRNLLKGKLLEIFGLFQLEGAYTIGIVGPSFKSFGYAEH